jgi:tryptophan synthase beta chain
VRVAIDEALDAKAKGEERVIVFGMSGHGLLDLSAYESYLKGKLEDYAYPEALIQEAQKSLPHVSL